MRIHDIPSVGDFVEGEQHESALLVVENGTCGEIVNLLNPSDGTGLPQLSLGHSLRSSIISVACSWTLSFFQASVMTKKLNTSLPSDRLLVLVHLAERVDENGIDSCDIHYEYSLLIGNTYIIHYSINTINNQLEVLYCI